MVKKSYLQDRDYNLVAKFLIETYNPNAKHVNWLQPRWEYMHYHPYIEKVDLSTIGLWEEDGRIVAAVHPELFLGTAYFQVHPSHRNLLQEMLLHAEEHIASSKDGVKSLGVYINDRDDEFAAIASDMGYVKTSESEPMSHIVMSDSFEVAPLPSGFRFVSLAESNDLRKLDRLMFRGFDHGEEPEEGGIQAREFMQSAPNYDMDINIVVEAPGGDFAAYCGMWHEPVNKVGYVEPVCTDPSYRRMGLGRSVVQEGVRRCGEKGVKVVYVGTSGAFYRSVGFTLIYNRSCWKKEWKA